MKSIMLTWQNLNIANAGRAKINLKYENSGRVKNGIMINGKKFKSADRAKN